MKRPTKQGIENYLLPSLVRKQDQYFINRKDADVATQKIMAEFSGVFCGVAPNKNGKLTFFVQSTATTKTMFFEAFILQDAQKVRSVPHVQSPKREANVKPIAFTKAVVGYGRNFLSRSSTKALFSDLLGNDIPKVNALLFAFDSGIIKTIENEYPLSPMTRSNQINRLVSQYSMNDAAATWAIDRWAEILTPTILKEIEEARQQECEIQKDVAETPPDVDTTSEPLDTIPDTESHELIAKDDLVGYYTNVKLNKVNGKIYIPCGVGTTDLGFYICGIKEDGVGSAPVVFALVYNYLVRNSTIMPEDYPHCLSRVSTTYQVNFQRVYRLMIILLQLIKQGKISYNAGISYDGKDFELELAISILNDYVALFSRLMRIRPIKLSWNRAAKKPIQISLDKKNVDVFVENNTTPCNARELWYADKINYQLGPDNLTDLEYILSEISPFDSFKEGQFTALTSMMNANSHSLCIMPTGSGKSLIFYFASLLQPLPVVVLAPTEILVDDQIRNLKKFHHMDNVSHLKLTTDNDFREFLPCTSLLYLTPMTFQSRHLLVQCRHFNDGCAMIKNQHTGMLEETRISSGPVFAYIVLDEIHCLSNWGHDFRAEYLMLSKFLKQFLSRIPFLGFTATANYTVVEDIQSQLSIPQQNISSPINFEKYNISYDFRAVSSTDEMVATTCAIVEDLIRKNERTLIFTKNEEISCMLAEKIGYEADVFQQGNTSAYHMFADEKCKVLVASKELGVGVNLPNIQNIIHFGLPVSKNEFVQEIGRAGRADEAVKSYVIYLDATENNVPHKLLSRQIDIPNISELLNSIDNDYSECYRKLNGGVYTKEELLDNVMNVYHELHSGGRALYVKNYPVATVDQVKKYIYMLYAIGYVYDWYAWAGNEEDGTVEIMIDVSSTNHAHFQSTSNMVQRMQKRAVAYYDSLGSNREQIVRTQRAKDIETIIEVYVDWYFAKFLYHHKELFLDFIDFIESNKSCDNEKITEDICEYFTLPFVEIKSDEAYYGKMTLSEVANKISRGIGRKTLANVERINSNRYSLNLDFFILLGTLKLSERFDHNRLARVMRNISESQCGDVRQAFIKVFEQLSPTARLNFVYGVLEKPELFGNTVEDICTAMYAATKKDVVYYGLLAKRLNNCFA